jgi:dienelactone hydrolase
MKTIIQFVVLFSMVSLLPACTQATPSPQPTQTASPTNTPQATSTPQATAAPVPVERLEAGQAFADQFLNRDYAAVVAQFDATMKSVFPFDKVQEARESLEPQLGAFRQQVGIRGEQVEQNGNVYDIVYVAWEFEKATIELRIVYDQAGQVAGLFFQPSQAMPPTPYAAPAYVDAGAFREQEVTVGSGEWALPGTLTMPLGDGPFPAVVLVHGSGPNDRDETIGPNKPFRDLAEGLASRGIAVLRYEKRTKQHAAQFTPEILAALTVQEETVDDALAAVALLRQTEGIDPARVYVLGHSLGGYVLPRIGLANPTLGEGRIAGLIALAGPTRPLEELTLEQVTYIVGLDGTVSADEQAALDQLAAQVARVQDASLSAETPAEDLPLNIPAAYWLDLRGYDPAGMAKGLAQPMLILQGERDYQVTTVDFEGWQAALQSLPNVTLKLYPDLNHLFMAGEGKSTPAEYEIAGHVAEQVIEDIVGWIQTDRMTD